MTKREGRPQEKRGGGGLSSRLPGPLLISEGENVSGRGLGRAGGLGEGEGGAASHSAAQPSICGRGKSHTRRRRREKENTQLEERGLEREKAEAKESSTIIKKRPFLPKTDKNKSRAARLQKSPKKTQGAGCLQKKPSTGGKKRSTGAREGKKKHGRVRKPLRHPA